MKIDVAHISQLANLSLTDEETGRFEKQLEKTLDFVKILEQVNTEDVKPTFQVTGLENVTRDDNSKPSLSQKEALENAKNTQDGFIKVKAVLEQ